MQARDNVHVGAASASVALVVRLPCARVGCACSQAYDALQRGKQRAEERAARAAEKAAKEDQKRADELRSYKTLMMVSKKAGGC